MAKLLLAMLEEPRLAEILRVNSFQGETFFSKEAFAVFTERLREAILWESRRLKAREGTAAEEDISAAMELLGFAPSLARKAKYKVDDLKRLLLEFSIAK